MKTHMNDVKTWLVLKMNNKFTKCFIIMLQIPNDNNDFFHGCTTSSLNVCMVFKQEG
jgi:hypothetical protein